MRNPQFDLPEFSKLSIMRNNDPQGFNCENKEGTFFIAAMVEELGEIAGALKKLERGLNPRERNKFIGKLKTIWNEKHPGQEERYSELTLHELETLWFNDKLSHFVEEGADLFIYWDVLLTKVQRQYGLQVDFFDTVKKKFNKVSLELNPQSTYII